MAEWKNSIITYIDLIGIKSTAEKYNSKASDVMRSMHHLVEKVMNTEMSNHDHCYIWNDSILLLSILESEYINRNVNDVMKEADRLKKKIDIICPSYAISVKGQIFPEDSSQNAPIDCDTIKHQPKTIKLKASSYAMGNCFLIESRLGKRLKKPWYVDSRIANQLDTVETRTEHSIKMLPKNKRRKVLVFNDYLW